MRVRADVGASDCAISAVVGLIRTKRSGLWRSALVGMGAVVLTGGMVCYPQVTTPTDRRKARRHVRLSIAARPFWAHLEGVDPGRQGLDPGGR